MALSGHYTISIVLFSANMATIYALHFDTSCRRRQNMPSTLTQIVAENSTDLEKRTKILSVLNKYCLRKSHRFWIRQNKYYVDIKWNIYHEYCVFLIYGQKLTFWRFQHSFVLAQFCFLLNTGFFLNYQNKFLVYKDCFIFVTWFPFTILFAEAVDRILPPHHHFLTDATCLYKNLF